MPKGSYLTQVPLVVPSCRLWLDANDPAGNNTLPSNGSALATWVDKSGFQYNATQATGAAQPIFTTNIINGKPVIRFNGSSQYIKVANTALAQSLSAGEFTAFVVMRASSATSFPTVFTTDPGPSSPRITFGVPFSATSFAFFDSCDVSTSRIQGAWGGTINTPYIFSARASVNGSTQAILRNTTSIATGTTPSTGSFGTSYKFTLGAFDTENSAINFFPGDIAELIIYNSYLDSTQYALVYSYISNKWGI